MQHVDDPVDLIGPYRRTYRGIGFSGHDESMDNHNRNLASDARWNANNDRHNRFEWIVEGGYETMDLDDLSDFSEAILIFTPII